MIIDTRLATSTALELLALVAIVWGVALVYIPAAFIVGGILGLVVAYLIDPPTRVKPPERGEQE